jgi:Ca2+-binding RTX toxin-like protein
MSWLYGTAGDDRLLGGDGNNALFGRGGNDFLSSRGDHARQFFSGGWGNDTIYGGSGYDYMLGGSGNDQLVSADGNDYLVGGRGNDTLTGGFGMPEENDYDTVTGGTGADLFVLGFDYGCAYIGDDYATITDFSRRQGDKIQVAGNAGDYSLSYSPALSGTEIYYQGDLIAIFQNTTNLSLALDFNFVPLIA